MNASIFGKRALSSVLHHSGYLRKRLKDTSQDGLLILMYHRVVDDAVARRLGQCGMYVDVETFEDHLKSVKRHFHVVPLAEAPAYLDPRKRNIDTGGMPPCAITFDDGWRDVYEYAYPLLRSHGMAATVFLPTGYIGTRAWFWTDRLARLLDKANSGKSKIGIQRATKSCSSLQRIAEDAGGWDIHKIVESLKPLRQEEIERKLDALSEEIGSPPIPEERAFLTWEEAVEMFRSGIVRFGSHTESHRILTTLSEEEIASELVRSKERLVAEGVVDSDFIPFAYPNGNHTERIANIVRASGYHLAVTTEKGWNYAEPGLDECRLKRVGIHQDITSTDALFRCRIAGIF